MISIHFDSPKEQTMAHLLIRFNVQDYAQWRAVFDEVLYLRQQFGCRGGHVFYNPENSNEVTVLLHWDSVEAATAYGSSAELREAQQRAGIIGKPDVSVLAEAEPMAV
jgi:quinol monooxygenase YgiN